MNNKSHQIYHCTRNKTLGDTYAPLKVHETVIYYVGILMAMKLNIMGNEEIRTLQIRVLQ
jgi:hypothetical protein